jgi:P27 family predicted phage terminase small subunit
MPGPAPKPVELKVLEGNPGKRRLPNSPKFAPLTEHAPDELPPLGQALWRRLTKELGHTNVVQRTDRELLLAACDCWALYQTNMALVRKYGALQTARNNNSERGALIVNPAWRVARDALREFNAIAAKFGLSPADRSRLTMSEVPDDEDPRLRLLT